MHRYLLNVLTAVDQLVNAVLGGDEDETVSSRLGKAQRGDFGFWWRLFLTPFAWLVDAFFFLFERQWWHCRRHIEEDEGASEILLKD